MAADSFAEILRHVHSLSGQLSKLSASVSVIEQRLKMVADADRKESLSRIRELQKELRELRKKIGTEPIALRQVMDTWWLRLVAILLLGAANIDLKSAIGLVLQLK